MSELFESYKGFNEESDFIKGLKKASLELQQKKDVEDNAVAPVNKVKAKIAVASGKFRKVAFDVYEKVAGEEVGSIWYLTTDSDSGEQWLTKDSDEDKEIVREIMSSVEKEAEMDETGYEDEYDEFFIDKVDEIQKKRSPHEGEEFLYRNRKRRLNEGSGIQQDLSQVNKQNKGIGDEIDNAINDFERGSNRISSNVKKNSKIAGYEDDEIRFDYYGEYEDEDEEMPESTPCPDLEEAGIPYEAYQTGLRTTEYFFDDPEDMEKAMDILDRKGFITPIFVNNQFGFELTRPVNEPTYF